MKTIGKQKALDLLDELQSNCGDNRGRDGEYLSDQVQKVIEAVENISFESEE